MTKIRRQIRIDGRDERLTEACLRIMNKGGYKLSTDVFETSTGHEIADAINKSIWEQNWSEEQKSNFVNKVVVEAKQNLIPLSELDWIKKNERACYWLWIRIVRERFCAYPEKPFKWTYYGNQDCNIRCVPRYDLLNLSMNTSSSEERFRQIVKFLDRIEQPIDWQRGFNDVLKSQWSSLFTDKMPFSWLTPKDEEQCKWAWEYLQSYGSKQRLIERPGVRDLKPCGAHELYLAIYAAFDAWNATVEAKELFKINFNKAWNQKKHRRNRTKVVACNFEIKKTIKEKLDHLSEVTGTARNKLIESLIEEKFSSLQRDDNNGKAG